MSYRFLAILVLFTNVYAQAQKTTTTKPKTAQAKGVIIFDKTAHNFGNVEEQNGKVVTNFFFTNIGKGNLTIKNVETSCGCTVSEWPKEAFAQGERGIITAEFDPINKVGPFSKTLSVITDGEPAVVYLTLNGEVYLEKQEIRNIYPFVQGHLRFTKYNLDLHPILETATDSVVFTVYNVSKRDMFITKVVTPEHIRSKVNQKILVPGNTTDIIYYFDAVKANDLGPRTDETFVYTTDDTLPKKIVPFKTTILQDFNKVTPTQKQNPPKLAIKELSHDLGEVYLDEVVSYEFEFTNKGKSDLLIRKAAPSCGCTVTSFSKEPIKKNKTGKLKVTFNAKDMRGIQDKSVTVYTNDPTNPILTLHIKAKVVIPGLDPISGK